MGRAMSALLAHHGHAVVLGTRSAEQGTRAIETLAGPIDARSYRDATVDADLVVLTTLWEHAEHAVRSAGPYEGRVLIDCTNPEGADGRSLAVGLTTSGAEHVARWANDARVVKAFNHVYAEVLSSAEALGRGVTVFVCGDDAIARRTVCDLATALGFIPLEAGRLSTARYLEPLAMLMVELVRGQRFAPTELILQASAGSGLAASSRS
jgi:predicted dinucleotide-binding enzyme